VTLAHALLTEAALIAMMVTWAAAYHLGRTFRYTFCITNRITEPKKRQRPPLAAGKPSSNESCHPTIRVQWASATSPIVPI